MHLPSFSDSKHPSDLAVVTSYFNPCGYQTRRKNLEVFRSGILKMGLPLFLVEGLFAGATDQDRLPDHWVAHRVTEGDVLWQKERLLNLMIRRVPSSFSKIVWLDADLVFEEPDWAWKVSLALEHYAVVQVFEEVLRLDRGASIFRPQGSRWSSFGKRILEDPQGLLLGDFERHGHTGFGWAARREVVDPGWLKLQDHAHQAQVYLDGIRGRSHSESSFPAAMLYDACVTGSGDHVMAHAWSGDFESPCITRVFGGNRVHRQHFLQWAQEVYPRVRAQVGSVPGRVLHLWHGEMGDRRYVFRNRELAELGFDPDSNLIETGQGTWAWNPKSPSFDALRAWALKYFESRREDGGSSEVTGTQDDLENLDLRGN